MKTWKACAIFVSSVLVANSSAFGFISTRSGVHTAHGSGSYKTPEGGGGDYTVEVEVNADCAKGEATISEHYTIGSETKDVFFRIVKAENDFFAVFAGDTKIGHGYCFKHAAKEMKTCHLGAKLENGWAERTMHFDMAANKIYRLGSFSINGAVTAWHDHLEHTDEHTGNDTGE